MDKKIVLGKNIACRVRRIRDRYILIGGKKSFELNSVAKYIWDEIDGEKSFEQIIDILKNEYDVAGDVAERDIACFLESLITEGIVDVVN